MVFHLVHGYFVDESNPYYQLLIKKQFEEVISSLRGKKLNWDELNVLGVALRGLCRYTESYNCFYNSLQLNPNRNAYFNIGKLMGETISFFRREDIFNALTGVPNLPSPNDINYSCFNEQTILESIFSKLSNINRYFVDIGASDGVTFSNTYPLVLNKWKGLAIEADPDAFKNLAYFTQDINLSKVFVNPKNVLNLLKAYDVPKNFGFLSLDIDSYDYYVLQELLKDYNPSVICTEINELFPPPIKFALKFTESNIDDKYLGQSISMVEPLLISHGYSIVALEYNNLIAVKNSCLSLLNLKKVSAEEAYNNGFRKKTDWFLKFIWNGEKIRTILALKPSDYPKFYDCVQNNDSYHFSLS